MDPRFAERYADLEQWHWWFRGRRRIIEHVVRRAVGGRASLAVASLGGGPAAGLGWLVPLAGPHGRVVALDAARAHARGLGAGLEYVIGDLAALPLAAASFDVVLVLDVLEHLDDDAAALATSAELLRPGGLLLLTVPALPSLWGAQDEVSHHRRRYTKKSLAQAFARAGLPRPDLAYFNALLLPPIAVVRWVRRALGRAEATRSDFEDNHPGLANELLARLFALERHLVSRVPLPLGVSLLATLRAPRAAR